MKTFAEGKEKLAHRGRSEKENTLRPRVRFYVYKNN